MNRKLWIAATSGLLTTIGNVAAAATIHSSFAATVPTTMPTAAASDSPPNMLLFTAAGLLAALFCAWRGCERPRTHATVADSREQPRDSTGGR